MKENKYLTLFKNALPKDFCFSESKAYFIKKFELSAEYLRMFEANFDKDDFLGVLNNMECNPEGCNLLVFYLENNTKGGEIFLVSNSLELNGKEFVLKKFNHVFDQKIFNTPNIERIN